MSNNAKLDAAVTSIENGAKSSICDKAAGDILHLLVWNDDLNNNNVDAADKLNTLLNQLTILKKNYDKLANLYRDAM
jgi:hypothetical protein